MTPEEFRKAGHELIDWIADYRQRVPDLPVRAQVAPNEIRKTLPKEAPESPETFEAVLSDLENIVVPGVTQVQHPMHYGWFPSNASLSSVLGDIASSGLGTLGISWESCPALTEVEQVVCDWLRQLTGLSEAWHGSIHDTASTACVTAMILAREKASDLSKNHGGLPAAKAPLIIYSTRQAHSSIAKAVQLAGFGNDNLRSTADGEVVQYRDWGIPLGRRFRALKLWFHLRLDGPDAIRERLRRDLENAQWFKQQIESMPGWEVLAPVDLQTVCIRHTPTGDDGELLSGDALDKYTLSWVDKINSSGEAFMSPSVLDDRWMVRISIGVESTEREHLERLLTLLRENTQG